jgi:hypothetical protein
LKGTASMNLAATETTAIPTGPGRTTGLQRASRSPVIGQLRTNPFRVLRLGPDVGVDRAIWKAEEALTRRRAGLPLAEPDLLPWLPEPDEPEIRQAIQRIEEPLRRLADESAWFDPDHDPDGELLRRALATLEPSLLNDYLARCESDGLPRQARAKETREAILADLARSVVTTNDGVPSNGPPTVDVPPEMPTEAVPRLLNHANLRLLLATLSLYDALSDGLHVPGAECDVEAKPAPIEWTYAHYLEACKDPHDLDLTGGRHAVRNRRTAALWSDALARWLRLVQSPVFLTAVHEHIARLGDEVVGDDDAEAIVNAASTRLMDLLVGEVKAQLLAGRMDRVRVLLGVAESSGLEPRRWTMAFRQLRPLFRTEAAELEPLLPQGDDFRFDDAAMYLSRLRTLVERWRTLDPTNLLGLEEMGDEAVLKACDALAGMESLETVDRLKALYSDAMSLASADSLKQRIAAAVGRVNGLENYACHFCRTREMDLRKSIVVTGKRESHRTYGFNSTTIHYVVNASIVPRCARCSDLHAYLWENSATVYAALGVAATASLGFIYWTNALGPRTEPMAYVFLAGIAVLVIWMLGVVARWISAWLATPRGERRYWKARMAKPYRDLKDQGCTMKIDYRRDAFPRFNHERDQQAS